MTKKLISVKELAEILNLHPVTIYRLVSIDKTLKAYRVGRNYRFDLDEVLRLAKEGKIQPWSARRRERKLLEACQRQALKDQGEKQKE